MRKSGSGCGKTLSFFIGMFVGVLVVVIGVVGVGLWTYNNLSLARLEKTFNVEINIGDEEFKNKAIKDLIPEVTNLMNSSVGEIASTLGYTIPTNIEVVPANGSEPAKYADLSEAMNIVLNGKITNVSSNLQKMIDFVTFGYVYSVLNEPMDMPNIKLFTKYKDVKVVNVGNIINQITVADIMEPNLNEGGQEIPYEGVLGAISDKTLVYLMQEGNMEATINSLKLEDVIEISETDTGILGSLKSLTIGSLNNDTIINAINDKKLGDILKITATNGVMSKLKDVTIGEISAGNIDDEIKSLKLSEIIEITDTQGIMFALKDKTISELNASTIMELKVSDIYNITDTEGVMYAIKDWKLNELTDVKFKTLQINQLIPISDTETGILGAIGSWQLNALTENNLQSLTLASILNIKTDTGILGALKDLSLKELTDDNIKTSIETLKLEDIITIEATDNNVWNAIKNSTIGELDNTLNSLTLSQFIEPNGTGDEEGQYVGLLGYLITETNDPLISEMDTALDDAVNAYIKDVTIGELIDNGVINEPTGYSEEEMAILRGTKLVDFINNNLNKQ